MAETATLRTHLVNELRDLVDAEQQLTRALPQFARATATPMLRSAFEQHLKETHRHVERLTHALEALGESVRPKRCDGMRGLISEGNALVTSTPKGALRDAMMITGAQKVEHYEMAAYGTARTYAEVLGRSDVARLLDDTLQEEKAADMKLTDIAESTVNNRAATEWHQQQNSSGLLEQSASLVGQTVGVAARGVRQAARMVGIDRASGAGLADTVNRAVDATTETLGDLTQSAKEQTRRMTRQAARAAQNVAADRTAATRPARRTVMAVKANRSAGRRRRGKKR